MYKTVVDSLEARVTTSDFRVYGMMHLPAHVGTAEVMNNPARPYLPLTRAMIYARGHVHPPKIQEFMASPEFLAIPKERIAWVYGGRPSPEQGVKFESRNLYLLYESYFLRGELRMTPGARLSDYLSGKSESKLFQNLYRAQLCVPIHGKTVQDTPPVEEFEFVTVNLRNAGGIFDLSPGAGKLSFSNA